MSFRNVFLVARQESQDDGHRPAVGAAGMMIDYAADQIEVPGVRPYSYEHEVWRLIVD
jgi:hypothetical protein